MINNAYRIAYDFHSEAMRTLDKMSVDDYWKWFWNRAEQIDNAQNDELVRDMIVTVALDTERRQKMKGM